MGWLEKLGVNYSVLLKKEKDFWSKVSGGLKNCQSLEKTGNPQYMKLFISDSVIFLFK